MINQSTRHPYAPAQNQRLERHLYQTIGQPVFLTIRAYKGSRPFQNRELASSVVECLVAERTNYGCDLHVYSLLPDHLHIVTSPRIPGGDAMTYLDRFKGKSTRIAWQYGVRGKLWQPRSYDHLVRKEEDLLAMCNYIVENPLRLSLVDRWEDYPFSGFIDPLPS